MPRYALDGMVAVSTGAVRGIGRGIAERLARAGCDIATLDLEDAGQVLDVGRGAFFY